VALSEPAQEQGRFGFGTSAPFPSNLAWQKAYNHPLHLSDKECTEAEHLGGKLHSLLSRSRERALYIGIDRLRATHDRSSDWDRILDSFIALEAILLKGKGGELSYRQAIRGAHLLAGSGPQRRETFDLLRDAYERRSRIIHGDEDPGKPGKPTADEIVEVTRKIVLKFVMELDRFRHKELLDELDLLAVEAPSS
jgi:hypothetical protein